MFLLQFIRQLLDVIPLAAAAENEVALPGDIKALQQHLCVVQLSRLLGIYHAMEKKQKLAVVRELMLRYRHGLEFGEGKSVMLIKLGFVLSDSALHLP